MPIGLFLSNCHLRLRSLFLLYIIIFSAINFIQAEPVAKPKLVVTIVVDQMRFDYLYKFYPMYGEGGFKKLLQEGFSFSNATYNYVPTYTGPGHAAIFTGTTPSINGIVANDWYCKSENKMVYCAEDPDVTPVGTNAAESKRSPVHLLTTTVGDELRLSNALKSRVYGVSLKDRGAILSTGHSANAAYWFDHNTGNFVTSSHYMKTLPNWVIAFNKKELVKSYLSVKWETFLKPEVYEKICAADDAVWEGTLHGETKPVFPHELPSILKYNNLGLIRATPFGNTLTVDFAEELVKAENLGKGDASDMLVVSFSSPDYIGHIFGPQSWELADNYVRLDRDLKRLLETLEKQVGKENLLVVLTADHGAAEMPSYTKTFHLPGGFLTADYAEKLKKSLQLTFGDTLLLKYENLNLYINKKHPVWMAKHAEISQHIELFTTSYKGFKACLSAQTLLFGGVFNDPVLNAASKGIYVGRSGDFVLIPEPGWVENYSNTTGTSHGTAYTYDTRVPLIWYGYNIPYGTTSTAVSITDIASTLSLFLQITYPSGNIGNPLNNHFKI